MIFKYGQTNCQSLQEYLNFLYDTNLKVDGIFGKETLRVAKPLLNSPTTLNLDELTLTIKRNPNSSCTEGKLYLNGKYFSNTLEDVERLKKIKNETAIPRGTYKTIINYSPKFKKEYPRLLDVPNFDGILIHCLTPDTEILTENGWQDLESFKSNPANRCYSYNGEQIELVPITGYVEREYNGLLYGSNGRAFNYEVTDKHRMLVNLNNEWQFMNADKVTSNCTFRVAASKSGESLSDKQKIFYRLIMATQADGYISMNSSSVRFHFTKERKINRIKELVSEMGCTYQLYVDKENKTTIYLDKNLSNEIAEYLNPFRYSFNYKELPMDLLILDSKDLKDLLLEYLFFDGRWTSYLKNPKDMRISSANSNTLNVLQAMAVCCGYRSYIVDENHCKVLVLYDGQELKQSAKFYSRPYNGLVWCLSNPNSTLIIRKNNRPMIIGNCGNTIDDTSGCILVGQKSKDCTLKNSRNTYNKLFSIMKGFSSFKTIIQ